MVELLLLSLLREVLLELLHYYQPLNDFKLCLESCTQEHIDISFNTQVHHAQDTW